jgi:hypothetical protein
LEELRAEAPEIAEKIMEEAKASVAADALAAAEAERRRLEEIDGIAALFDPDLVKEAKYGEKACTAQEMAYRAAQKNAEQGKAFLAGIKEDFGVSGAGEVGAAPAGDGSDEKPLTPSERMAQGRADAKKVLNKEEK